MKKVCFISLMVFLFFLFIPGVMLADDDKKDVAIVIVDKIMEKKDKLNKKQIAVLDFTDLNGEETEEGKLLAEQILSKLLNYDSIIVVERKQVDKVLKEQALNVSGATESDDDQDIGKLLKAEAVISGTIVHSDEDEEVNARVIDVKTGEIYCAANVKRQLKFREKEFEKLPEEQREKIQNEFKERNDLKQRNPDLYKIMQKHKEDLIHLRKNNPQVFHKVVSTIRLMERLKRERPRDFLLVTEPQESQKLEMVKKKNPEMFNQKIVPLRNRLNFIVKHSPAYKQKLIHDRQEIIDRVKENKTDKRNRPVRKKR